LPTKSLRPFVGHLTCLFVGTVKGKEIVKLIKRHEVIYNNVKLK